MPKARNKKREDGRLQSKVYLGNGKYKYVYAANNKELEEKVQEVKLKIGKGLDVSAERDSFGFWADKWLKLKQLEVSHGRFLTYKARYKNLESIFYMQVSKIRTSDIQDIILGLAQCNPKTEKPMAKKSNSQASVSLPK